MGLARDRGIGVKRETSGCGMEPFLDMAKLLMTTSYHVEMIVGCDAAMLAHGLKHTDDNIPSVLMFYDGMQFGMAHAMKVIATGEMDLKAVMK